MVKWLDVHTIGTPITLLCPRQGALWHISEPSSHFATLFILAAHYAIVAGWPGVPLVLLRRIFYMMPKNANRFYTAQWLFLLYHHNICKCNI